MTMIMMGPFNVLDPMYLHVVHMKWTLLDIFVGFDGGVQHSLEYVAPFGALHQYRLGFGHAPIPSAWGEGKFAKDPKYGMYLPP